MPVSAEGRVEHQKLNQTEPYGAVWLSFWCSTRFTGKKSVPSNGVNRVGTEFFPRNSLILATFSEKSSESKNTVFSSGLFFSPAF